MKSANITLTKQIRSRLHKSIKLHRSAKNDADPVKCSTFVEFTAKKIAAMTSTASSTQYDLMNLIDVATRHILLFVGGYATKALSSMVTNVCWELCKGEHSQILQRLRNELSDLKIAATHEIGVDEMEKLKFLHQVL